MERLHSVKCEVLVKIGYMYCDPKSVKDLKTILFISQAINPSVVFHSSI